MPSTLELGILNPDAEVCEVLPRVAGQKVDSIVIVLHRWPQ